jgi:DNA-directed RNA polymerase specialized sigma24 family protein
MLRLIASALRDVGSGPREAFILFAIEGFGIEEIAAITGRPAEGVVSAIAVAREHLRKAPGVAQREQGRRGQGKQMQEKRAQKKIAPLGAA